MDKLTAAEEEVMQLIWKLERGTVSQMIDLLPEPKPPHSTISSIVRILEKKGFVDHKAYGRTYEYFAIISKAEYAGSTIRDVVADYFGGSANRLVNFLARKGDLSLRDIDELKGIIKNSENLDQK